MPDLDTTIADGDPGHALLHQDANTEINSLRGRVLTAEGTISDHTTTLGQKYTKPGTGIPLTDLSTAALNGLVQGDGTVLHVVKLTQAAYDALATRPATTLYVISG